MTTIDGVVFDYGGVLSAPQDGSILYPKIEQAFGVSEAKVREGFVKYRLDQDADLISPEEMYRRILADNGVSADEAALVDLKERDCLSWALPNADTIAWAKELKSAGFKIGILTNMPACFIPYFEKAAGSVRRIADAELISGPLHMVKPHKATFLKMAELMHLSPERLLFFDDNEANITGARSAGFNAHLFTTASEAKHFLNSNFKLG